METATLEEGHPRTGERRRVAMFVYNSCANDQRVLK